MARGGLHHRGGPRLRRRRPDPDRRRGATRPAGPRPGRGQHPGRQHRHQVLRRGRAPADRRRSTARTSSTAAACASTPRSTSTCSGPPGTRSPRTLDQPTDPDAALVAVDEYGHVKAMVGGRDFESDEVNLAARRRGRRLRPRRRLVVQALRARRGHPPGHLAQLEVRRAGGDHLRRRAGRQGRRALEGRQLRRHRAGRARPRRRHPRVRPTPPTRS